MQVPRHNPNNGSGLRTVRRQDGRAESPVEDGYIDIQRDETATRVNGVLTLRTELPLRFDGYESPTGETSDYIALSCHFTVHHP